MNLYNSGITHFRYRLDIFHVVIVIWSFVFSPAMHSKSRNASILNYLKCGTNQAFNYQVLWNISILVRLMFI